jgi:osmotically-inducible protein OsmY
MFTDIKTIANRCNIERNNTLHGIFFLILMLFALPSWAWAAGLSDTDITFWVKDALRRDARVNAQNLHVNTAEGIVTLSGTVDNLAAKSYAALETKKIDGVLGVINEIHVTPNWCSDTDIRATLRRRILNSTVIKSEGLSVACFDGKVSLSGKVASYSEKKEAELIASEIRGVKDVTNNITVEWATKRSDQEIKDDAVAALERDVYVTDLPLTVTVSDRSIPGNHPHAQRDHGSQRDHGTF